MVIRVTIFSPLKSVEIFASIFRNRQFGQVSFTADGTSVRKISFYVFEFHKLVVLTERIQYHTSLLGPIIYLNNIYVQGGSNMTGTDLCVNKPHCAAAVRP